MILAPDSSALFPTIGSAPLIIFEMANNHMGDVEHGLRIIRELHEATATTGTRRVIKFQYRQIDTFIHPDFKGRSDIKYVKRFEETRLSEEEFLQLKNEALALGFLTACTPFDEESVPLVEKHGYDILKIASASFTDWPLLERAVQTSLPIVASAAGASLEDIDRVVSFLEHRKKTFALMHCVAEYPTPDALLSLSQIDLFRARYPSVPVGFSTHERPEALDPVKLAVAKGAVIVERHVGVPTEKYALNAYSSTPEQAASWVRAALCAVEMCGVAGERAPFTAGEIRDLHGLRRGVFAREAIARGDIIDHKNLFFAIPTGTRQYTANGMSKYAELRATEDIAANGAVTHENAVATDRRELVNNIVKRVRDYVRLSNVPLPSKADVEISHHYGVERFPEVGAVLLSFVNRSYCKKAIVMLPGQRHPEHQHKVKEETFFVLHGSMKIALDGVEQDVSTGDSVLVEPGVKHWFSTDTGVIFEEISSTHIAQDSFYSDPAIMENKGRKTYVTHWIQ
jgi:sialic acid synthase SpsE/quercetin dioxygenase-like cupin family protein